MNLLSKHTRRLLDCSSISFCWLNFYIIYSKFEFNLYGIKFVRYFSVAISLIFIISTLTLIYKMVLFAINSIKNYKESEVRYGMIFLFYVGVFFYGFFMLLLKTGDFYFNINIYSIVSVMAIFCLIHSFFTVKSYLEKRDSPR